VSIAASFDIDDYRGEDEPAVLELLTAALGAGPTGSRSSAFFRWKHEDNPFGRSFMLVARDGERVIGLRAFMRWEFRIGGRRVGAVRAVDTATHPEYHGRGVFSRLTRAALDVLPEEVALVFNTPNDASRPGYLKMGWRPVGRIPVWVRVRRPIRFVRSVRALRREEPPVGPPPEVSATSAAQALERATPPPAAEDPERLVTARTTEYMRWRYAAAPFDYRVVEDGHGGMAVFRVRSRGPLWEATVAEVLLAEGGRAAARRLLGRVARAAGVDHVTCSFPARWIAARGARLAGFVPAPSGPWFVVRPLRRDLGIDPTTLRAWGLTLGDLEVF
jgi:predicted N-acetyltransferase YhbS